MGLLGLDATRRLSPKEKKNARVSIELLHQGQCNVCPLNREWKHLRHPHMEASGAENPIVYMLGEAPGKNEDLEGRQFVGKSGSFLKNRIPRDWKKELRYNNCVRTRPPGNRDPTFEELECCRPSVAADIERSKPRAIFGFGGVPLNWMLGITGINTWAGRRIPVRIGSHECWYFAFNHPSYIGRMLDEKWMVGKDLEFTFEHQLEAAFNLVDDLPPPIVHTPDDAVDGIEIITGEGGEDDLAHIKKFLDYLLGVKMIGFDLETHSEGGPPKSQRNLRPYDNGEILSAAFSDGVDTLAFALDHPQAGWVGRQRDKVFALLQDFLRKYKGTKIAHHSQFEMEWCAHRFGPQLIWGTKWADTMSQAYTLNVTEGMLSLEYLALQYFGINIKKLHNLDVEKLHLAELARVLMYNGCDAKYHRNLFSAQYAELTREGMLQQYADHIIRIPTMVLTQFYGLPFDPDVVDEFKEKYVGKDGELTIIEAKLATLPECQRFRTLKGYNYRPGAPEDVKYAFKVILRKPIDSADEENLSRIKHPLADLTLKWRESNKLWSTYVKPLIPGHEKSVVYPDGLLHPSISTMKVRTTRTSSDGPNTQNYPKHVHREVRRQIRHKRKKVVTFDYAGMQARNIGMESHDPSLVKAFWDMYDIHDDWMWRIADQVPRWAPGGIKALKNDKALYKLHRNKAKNELVFPFFFGAQPSSVAGYLGIPDRDGYVLSEAFWHQFGGIRDWQEGLRQAYERDGYVTGLSGFRRHAPVGPNELVNSPIQADETIIVTTAMAELSQRQEPERFQASMEIHDDLTFFWDKAEIEKNAEVVIEHMLLTPFEWAHVVPIQVEMSIGDDWASVEEVGVYKSVSPDKWVEVPK